MLPAPFPVGSGLRLSHPNDNASVTRNRLRATRCPNAQILFRDTPGGAEDARTGDPGDERILRPIRHR
jgi:hypothetical protein